MKITDVKIRKLTQDEMMKAIVSVSFDDVFAVHDIKVIEKDGRHFVAMPSKKMQSGEYRDIAHPIVKEFREELEGAILAAYKEAVENAEREENAPL